MENENLIQEENDFNDETKINKNINKQEDVNEKILKKVKKIELTNYLIVLLLAVVLVFNVLRIDNDSQSSTNIEQKKLPKSLNEKEANELIKEISQYYNENDYEKLYNILGNYAKTSVPYDEFTKSVVKLKALGQIDSASYTHYEYLGYQEGADWFVLNYLARFNTGNGDITVTILEKNNNWEVVGFRLNIKNFN